MKKIIALLLAAVMVLGLAACAGKPADTTPTGDTKPADTKTTDSTTKATEPAAAAHARAPPRTPHRAARGLVPLSGYTEICLEECQSHHRSG